MPQSLCAIRETSAWDWALSNTGLETGGLRRGMDISRFNGLRLAEPVRLRPTRAEPLQGEARYFARIFQIKFVFDVRPVGLHSLGAEM